MKGELQGSIYVGLEGTPEIFFQEALKIAQKGEEKDTLAVVIDGTHGSAIEGTS